MDTEALKKKRMKVNRSLFLIGTFPSVYIFWTLFREKFLLNFILPFVRQSVLKSAYAKFACKYIVSRKIGMEIFSTEKIGMEISRVP